MFFRVCCVLKLALVFNEKLFGRKSNPRHPMIKPHENTVSSPHHFGRFRFYKYKKILFFADQQQGRVEEDGEEHHQDLGEGWDAAEGGEVQPGGEGESGQDTEDTADHRHDAGQLLPGIAHAHTRNVITFTLMPLKPVRPVSTATNRSDYLPPLWVVCPVSIPTNI